MTTPDRAANPPSEPRCGAMRIGVQCARPKGHPGRHIWRTGRSDYETGVYDESERHRRG